MLNTREASVFLIISTLSLTVFERSVLITLKSLSFSSNAASSSTTLPVTSASLTIPSYPLKDPPKAPSMQTVFLSAVICRHPLMDVPVTRKTSRQTRMITIGSFHSKDLIFSSHCFIGFLLPDLQEPHQQPYVLRSSASAFPYPNQANNLPWS